mmetsp:Transcript_13732/g.39794  ORF Transcript_13732/g.39794 Transcript_13732/m.39794 type:complete len:232 (-) Transcript_13732:495-1190(-)
MTWRRRWQLMARCRAPSSPLPTEAASGYSTARTRSASARTSELCDPGGQVWGPGVEAPARLPVVGRLRRSAWRQQSRGPHSHATPETRCGPAPSTAGSLVCTVLSVVKADLQAKTNLQGAYRLGNVCLSKTSVEAVWSSTASVRLAVAHVPLGSLLRVCRSALCGTTCAVWLCYSLHNQGIARTAGPLPQGACVEATPRGTGCRRVLVTLDHAATLFGHLREPHRHVSGCR